MTNFDDIAAQSLNFIKSQMNVNQYTLFPKFVEDYDDGHTGRLYGSVQMPADAAVDFPSYIKTDQFYDEVFTGVCSGTHHNVGVARTNLGVEISTYSDKKYTIAVAPLRVDGTWKAESFSRTTEVYGVNGVPNRWITYWSTKEEEINTTGSNAIKGFTLKYFKWLDDEGNFVDVDNLPESLSVGETIEGQELISTETFKLKPIMMDDDEIEDAVPHYPDYVADLFTLTDVEYLTNTSRILYDETVLETDMPQNPDVLPIEPESFIRDVVFSPSVSSNKMEVSWITNFFGNCTIVVNGKSFTAKPKEIADGYRSFSARVDVTKGAMITYSVTGGGTSFSGSLDYPNTNVYRICGDPQITDEQSALNWYTSQSVESPFGKKPKMLISMGDQIDSINNSKLKKKQYTMFSHELVTPIMVARGNHDKNETYFAQYSTPNSDINIDGGYHFIHDGTLFVVIDTNSKDYVRHKAVIEAGLASGSYSTAILVMHHSMYTVGSNTYAANVAGLRTNLGGFIQSKPFHLILAGHDHIYCRNWIGNKLYVVAPSSSGSKYYKIENANAPWADVYQELKIPCVIDMEINSTDIKLKMLNYEGTVLDEVTVNK